MKAFFYAFFLIGILGATGRAECSYFRVAVHLLKCAPADPKMMKANNMYPSPAEVSEFDDPAVPTFAQVSCSCDYSLTGSDPRCDTDQTIERSSVTGAANPALFCRRGPAVCKDLCPPRLP